MAVEVEAAAPHQLFVAGGSYAGISAVLNLLHIIDGTHPMPNLFPEALLQEKPARGVHITLVDERDGFYHTVGTPLAHVSRKYTDSFWRKFTTLRPLQRKEITIVRGSVKSIDCDARVATFSDLDQGGKEFRQRYDYLVLATGLRRGYPAVPRALLKTDYLQDSFQHISGIEGAAGDGVVVIGGGAVGIEMAGEVRLNHPTKQVTLVHSRSELLSNEPLPDEFKQRAKLVLEEEGVRVILGQRATVAPHDGTTSTITLTNGEVLHAGHVIPAASSWTAVSDSLPPDAVDEHGYVKVNAKMQFSSAVPNAARHYAIGDVAAWSGIRRSGAGMAMGRVAATNILSSILQDEDPTRKSHTVDFPEVPPMMVLAVGSQAIWYGPKVGMKWGKEVMKETFGSDLGWDSILQHFGFADPEKKEDDDGEVEKLGKLSLGKKADESRSAA